MPAERTASTGAPFATTHWSVVLAAGQGVSSDAQEALERLCRTYWYPLYAFARRQGRKPEEAQDLTQGFFARLLEKDYFRLANPARGRFRTFLLTGLKAFITEEHRHSTRLKRGGENPAISYDDATAEQRYRVEPREESTPETLYEERWALTLLETALANLGDELALAGKEQIFASLKGQLWGEPPCTSYAELSAQLGLSEGALKVTVHRLRQRFRELLRAEVAHTIADAEEIDDELRHLIGVVRHLPL